MSYSDYNYETNDVDNQMQIKYEDMINSRKKLASKIIGLTFGILGVLMFIGGVVAYFVMPLAGYILMGMGFLWVFIASLTATLLKKPSTIKYNKKANDFMPTDIGLVMLRVEGLELKIDELEKKNKELEERLGEVEYRNGLSNSFDSGSLTRR